MPGKALYRTDRTIRLLDSIPIQQRKQGLGFGLVAYRCSRTMGLIKANRRHLESGLRVGPAKCPHLTRRLGRRHTQSLAVTGSTYPLDHRIDPITVSLRIDKAF